MLSSEKMQWFAMRATYRRGMQIKALLDKEGINNFIPMRYEVRIRNGRKRRELVPVISDLIFVHAVQSELQKVKFKLPYFQYMIDNNYIDSDDKLKDVLQKQLKYIDLYLDKLDLLISIAVTFYNAPNAIEFDEEHLSASPALDLLTKKDALIFQDMIVDERYKDLLITVGQPVKEDNLIFDSAPMKFLLLGGAVGDSEKRCRLAR